MYLTFSCFFRLRLGRRWAEGEPWLPRRRTGEKAGGAHDREREDKFKIGTEKYTILNEESTLGMVGAGK